MVSFSGVFERRARALLLLAPLLAPLPARAEIEPGDLTLTVTAELNGNSAPFSREMVLLKIHGVYKQPILLEEVVQPSLANFSWTQLGRDHWSKTKLPDGQSAIAFDRTVAVFPHHAGQFTIEPFTHKLTVNDVGERRVVEVRSKPIPFPVAQWTEPSGGPDAKEPWWLPAKDVAITDSWSPDPETIKVGETTRRIVTLEAQGMVAEGLPPRPVMRTRGIITFAGPVTRETLLTPSGPVARATYQWDVKPGVPEIIPLDAIAIPWFDTNTRTMRETEIPARQIGGGLPDRETDRAPPAIPSPLVVAASALAAFGLGLALIGFGLGRPSLRLSRPTRRALQAAARSGDPAGFRAVLDTAMREAPDLARIWRARPGLVASFAALDRSVFGASGAPVPDLRALANALSRSEPVAAAAREPDRLAPLDGPAR
ncbi:clustering-based subsystem [Methylobacterium phyllosphaerae]|uniref:Clustering-based subsystem n=1 Tax=Methylobacterium phyllosphaerae TaxID=418223 RepID=A0AAE8HX49_9HYPH|nr:MULTISPECIES: BatD family protein [Methylobacterium]APT33097.1 clustering-based subsystem [Methylobacterium phyllosphaerae]WFS06598.1 BatD family protein [Methylobacterium sp. 391_Methyba4]SFH57920.1 Oxygen tolerance [Methylobacterium phyllosphaerae]